MTLIEEVGKQVAADRQAEHDAEAGDRQLYLDILRRAGSPRKTDSADLVKLMKLWDLTDADLQQDASAILQIDEHTSLSKNLDKELAETPNAVELNNQLSDAIRGQEESEDKHREIVQTARGKLNRRRSQDNELSRIKHGLQHLLKKHTRLKQ